MRALMYNTIQRVKKIFVNIGECHVFKRIINPRNWWETDEVHSKVATRTK